MNKEVLNYLNNNYNKHLCFHKNDKPIILPIFNKTNLITKNIHIFTIKNNQIIYNIDKITDKKILYQSIVLYYNIQEELYYIFYYYQNNTINKNNFIMSYYSTLLKNYLEYTLNISDKYIKTIKQSKGKEYKIYKQLFI